MKTALLYVLLVGLPVAGLFAVLQVGGLAEAPPAVGGAWTLSRGAACDRPTERLDVVQSGVFVSVSALGVADVPARLAGDVLQTEPGPTGCDGAVRLEAHAGQEVAERLEGALGVPGCAACPVAEFTAVRLAEAPAAPPARSH